MTPGPPTTRVPRADYPDHPDRWRRYREPFLAPTLRQLEVFRACVYWGNQEAAHRLGITMSTVKNLNRDLYLRIGVDSRGLAVAWLDDHMPGWRERIA